MNSIYSINTELDIPIYRQLVDSIRMAVKKGELPGGYQLPTVQELTQQLGIARGTVKRAYDELEQLGLVEKMQGRGTFVRYQPSNSESRKERAMAAIDTVLDQLENMGFSAAEINIFLNLKLRERAEQEAHIKVAVVECNPETLAQISEQLRYINGVDLYSFLLENVQQYPYKLGEEYDLIITTAKHSEYIESVVPVKKKVVRVALRLSATSLSQIIKLRPGKNVGILSYSKRFGDLLYNTCQEYTEGVVIHPPMVVDVEEKIETYLAGKDVVLVAKTYGKYQSQEIRSKLRNFQGAVIDCCYEMDEGSVLYLQTRIGRLLEEKKI